MRFRSVSSTGRLGFRKPILLDHGAVWLSPESDEIRGIGSWHLLWLEHGPTAEQGLRNFLNRLPHPPVEVLIAGPCGALAEGMPSGMGFYASEVLDPRLGPHWPSPSRSIAPGLVGSALGGVLRTGKLLTTDVPCTTPEHKRESGRGYGALAVDRDSALLCRPCKERDLAHAVCRLVLDPVDVDLSPEAAGSENALRTAGRSCELALFRILAAL